MIHTLPGRRKSRHLDLTKQIGMSLLLDNYWLGNYLSAGNKLFNPNSCQQYQQSFVKPACQKKHPVIVEKNIGLFENGQIIGLHQEKTSKEIAETA